MHWSHHKITQLPAIIVVDAFIGLLKRLRLDAMKLSRKEWRVWMIWLTVAWTSLTNIFFDCLRLEVLYHEDASQNRYLVWSSHQNLHNGKGLRGPGLGMYFRGVITLCAKDACFLYKYIPNIVLNLAVETTLSMKSISHSLVRPETYRKSDTTQSASLRWTWAMPIETSASLEIPDQKEKQTIFPWLFRRKAVHN